LENSHSTAVVVDNAKVILSSRSNKEKASKEIAEENKDLISELKKDEPAKKSNLI
jgi:hypothetical protein